MKPGVETRTVAEAERGRLKRDHLEAFRDGGRAALGLPDASREAGNYPCGFCGWPLEKRRLALHNRQRPHQTQAPLPVNLIELGD